MTDNRIEQVKKIITDLCDGCEVDGVSTGLIEIASKEIVSALYSEPQVVCPKPEQMVICPKAVECKYICGSSHDKPHNQKDGCIGYPLQGCPACIPVPSTPASDGMLLTDEEMYDIIEDAISWGILHPDFKKYHELIEAKIRETTKYILAKCHQSEAAEIKELKSQLESCVNTLKERDNQLEKAEARIKELKIDIEELTILNQGNESAIRADQNKKIATWIQKNDNHFIFHFIPECGGDFCFLATEGMENECAEPDEGAGHCQYRDKCRYANKQLLFGQNFIAKLQKGDSLE